MSNITVFAAADYQYFYDHGYAFAKSANKAGHRCLIYVFPDLSKDFKEESKKFILFLTKEFYPKIDSDLTEIRILNKDIMESFEKSKPIIDRRALFASIRFMILDQVLRMEEEQTGNNILVLDIDSVINRQIKIPKKYDIGLFLREDENLGQTEYEKIGMKVAAGAVYVTHRAHIFVEKFSQFLTNTQKRWFCDQYILYLLYKEFEERYNVLKFDNKFLDWEFKNDAAYIYTGKGARKQDKNYLKIKEELSE